MNADLLRAQAFSQRLGLAMPLLMAPMAGVPAIALASAVGQAGGMAALGALLTQCSAASRRRCARRQSKRANCSRCRPGPGRGPRWRGLIQRGRF